MFGEEDGRYAKGTVSASVNEADPSLLLIDPQGQDWQLKEIADACHSLSVLPKFIKGTNFFTLPKTWAVVTQLARMGASGKFQWQPDSDLMEWIKDEFFRRHTTGKELKFDYSDLERDPMPHQLAGAFMGSLNHRVFFADDMGPQPVTTPILTPSGWTELGKLTSGDYVYGIDGEPTLVEEVKFFGERPVYSITFKDRTSTLATADHRWTVQRPGDRSGSWKRRMQPVVMTTMELIQAGLKQSGNSKFFVPQQPVISNGTPQVNLPVPAYLYGALLGDGSLGNTSLRLTSNDEDILYRVAEEARYLNTTSLTSLPGKRAGEVSFHRNGDLRQALDSLDALHTAYNKFVHPSYLSGDAEVRLELLRGLLDTDGHVMDNGLAAEFVSVSHQLAEDVAFIARSLGAVVTESDAQESGYVNLAGSRIRCSLKYRVYIRMPADSPSPFWTERKHNRWESYSDKVQRRNPPRAFESIESAGTEEVCCIRVKDSRHVYLTDKSLIPTHNTGKTATALLTLAELDAQGKNPFPAFIVCPASVVDPTLEEIDAWGFNWTYTAYRGAKRKNLSSKYQVYVMSWDVFRRDMQHPMKPVLDIEGNQLINDKGKKVWEEDKTKLPPLLSFNRPHTVVMDEAHALCNDSKQSQAARAIAKVCDYVFPMSGTPITKDVSGFFHAMKILDTRSFPNKDRYKELYCESFQKNIYEDKVTGISEARRDEFFLLLQGQMRRVATADVLKDLPPKRHLLRYVEIPDAYKAAYKEMEEDMLAHVPDVLDPMEAMSTLAQLTRLMQLACSSCDVTVEESEEIDDETGLPKRIVHVKPQEPSWKIDEMMNILDDNQGNPVVAFGTHASLMNLAGARAEKAGLKVGYIIGGQSAKERTKNRLAFQNGELDLICVTTAAGGVGLTLTASDTAVFLERPWGYWQSSQSEARIHRRGQTRECFIIDIISKGTIEERIREAIKEKAGALSELVRDGRIIREVLGGK